MEQDKTHLQYGEAVEAFARDPAKLDSATAHAVAAEAREIAQAAFFMQTD